VKIVQVEEPAEEDQEYRLEESEELVPNTNAQQTSQQRSTEPMTSQKKKNFIIKPERNHYKNERLKMKSL
jgi:hypothetical protein